MLCSNIGAQLGVYTVLTASENTQYLHRWTKHAETVMFIICVCHTCFRHHPGMVCSPMGRYVLSSCGAMHRPQMKGSAIPNKRGQRQQQCCQRSRSDNSNESCLYFAPLMNLLTTLVMTVRLATPV